MKSLYSAQHVTARSRCTVGSHKAHVIYRHEMFRLDKKREAKSFFFYTEPSVYRSCVRIFAPHVTFILNLFIFLISLEKLL